eukprot:GHVP01059341.1.p1 GENE.GHVP01059341.1~~GHVP01059341.1.p1  ORF type:complete len:637 (-),score=95.84 GHVP01059341.1:786-2696(-)
MEYFYQGYKTLKKSVTSTERTPEDIKTLITLIRGSDDQRERLNLLERIEDSIEHSSDKSFHLEILQTVNTVIGIKVSLEESYVILKILNIITTGDNISDEIVEYILNSTLLAFLFASLDNKPTSILMIPVEILKAISETSPIELQTKIIFIPNSLSSLLNMIRTRNILIQRDTLIILRNASKKSNEVQKMLTFESAFEAILTIIILDNKGTLSSDIELIRTALEFLSILLSDCSTSQRYFVETIGTQTLSKILENLAHIDNDSLILILLGILKALLISPLRKVVQFGIYSNSFKTLRYLVYSKNMEIQEESLSIISLLISEDASLKKVLHESDFFVEVIEHIENNEAPFYKIAETLFYNSQELKELEVSKLCESKSEIPIEKVISCNSFLTPLVSILADSSQTSEAISKLLLQNGVSFLEELFKETSKSLSIYGVLILSVLLYNNSEQTNQCLLSIQESIHNLIRALCDGNTEHKVLGFISTILKLLKSTEIEKSLSERVGSDRINTYITEIKKEVYSIKELSFGSNLQHTISRILNSTLKGNNERTPEEYILSRESNALILRLQALIEKKDDDIRILNNKVRTANDEISSLFIKNEKLSNDLNAYKRQNDILEEDNERLLIDLSGLQLGGVNKLI